jgi:hypothetical protein
MVYSDEWAWDSMIESQEDRKIFAEMENVSKSNLQDSVSEDIKEDIKKLLIIWVSCNLH